MNYSSLPADKKYSDLLWIFLAPYILYVASNALKDSVDAWLLYAIKIVMVSGVLYYFKTNYRLGQWSAKNIAMAICATPFMLLLWIAPLYYSFYFWGVPLPQNNLQNIEMSEYYWLLHTFSAFLLVPIFEELFCRVYLLEFLYQTSLDTNKKSITDKINDTMDQYPQNLKNLNFNAFSILGVLLFFTVGHGSLEYLSCILYFGATQIVYRYTGSLSVCIAIHAFTNLSIAFLVKYYHWEFLWF